MPWQSIVLFVASVSCVADPSLPGGRSAMSDDSQTNVPSPKATCGRCSEQIPSKCGSLPPMHELAKKHSGSSKPRVFGISNMRGVVLRGLPNLPRSLDCHKFEILHSLCWLRPSGRYNSHFCPRHFEAEDRVLLVVALTMSSQLPMYFAYTARATAISSVPEMMARASGKIVSS